VERQKTSYSRIIC